MAIPCQASNLSQQILTIRQKYDILLVYNIFGGFNMEKRIKDFEDVETNE